ncbi:hypothetical protein [Pseudoteredinibacter isoporae]|uniref:hypothetical protein n=1 Tax=Pseudoteredinibacter isoporae TaxID=570281 RepID=UPI003109CB6D
MFDLEYQNIVILFQNMTVFGFCVAFDDFVGKDAAKARVVFSSPATVAGDTFWTGRSVVEGQCLDARMHNLCENDEMACILD